ncbi:MAG TPA: hypothetical protein VEL76_35765 [Gemmataceae bacterium]|nr:hypothetical protein [Gemmataceae bacterium]
MTESEWRYAGDCEYMLRFLGREASPRKLRLFVVACCRRAWHLLSADWRSAVELAERCAEGLVDQQDLEAVRVPLPLVGQSNDSYTKRLACEMAVQALSASPFDAALATSGLMRQTVPLDGNPYNRRDGACVFLRDIFHPYRPFSIDAQVLRWNGACVM